MNKTKAHTDILVDIKLPAKPGAPLMPEDKVKMIVKNTGKTILISDINKGKKNPVIAVKPEKDTKRINILQKGRFIITEMIARKPVREVIVNNRKFVIDSNSTTGTNSVSSKMIAPATAPAKPLKSILKKPQK